MTAKTKGITHGIMDKFFLGFSQCCVERIFPRGFYIYRINSRGGLYSLFITQQFLGILSIEFLTPLMLFPVLQHTLFEELRHFQFLPLCIVA